MKKPVSRENGEQSISALENNKRLGTQLEEIPFVPLSQRQFVSTSFEDKDTVGRERDGIVVVGRKRTRTRTRNRNRKRKWMEGVLDQMNEGEAGAGMEVEAGAEMEVEGEGEGNDTFDFTAVSNILDNPHEHQHQHEHEVIQPLKKRKRRHGKAKAQGETVTHFFFDHAENGVGAMSSPIFVLPPRAYRETKGGNQSRTFK